MTRWVWGRHPQPSPTRPPITTPTTHRPTHLVDPRHPPRRTHHCTYPLAAAGRFELCFACVGQCTGLLMKGTATYKTTSPWSAQPQPVFSRQAHRMMQNLHVREALNPAPIQQATHAPPVGSIDGAVLVLLVGPCYICHACGSARVAHNTQGGTCCQLAVHSLRYPQWREQ